MAKKALKFDPQAHVYTVEGRKVISNTDFLTAMGFCDYSGMPPERRATALEVGSDVHDASLLFDQRLNWRKMYSHVSGYMNAWRKFKKDFKFKPNMRFREQPLYDPMYDLATTPDAHGESIHGDITAQIKTGKVQDWVGLQLAFEERCIFISQGKIPPRLSTDKRFAIELHADGTYKPYRFQDPNEIVVYLGGLAYFRWLQRKVPQFIINSNQEVL